MPIRTKRIYDPPAPEDGHRLLVMRLWPRGIRKSAVDAWQKDLAPSEKLRRAYLHGGLPWEAFAKAYVDEVAPRTELVLQIARLAQDQTITLLCACQEETRCHRAILRSLIEAAEI